MKTIQPISIWDNGTNQNATILNAYCINDNLSTSAAFYYALLSNDKAQLAQGNLTMSGEIYNAWETNDYAYNWIAEQLNLTIIGDYVPPVPEPVIETTVQETLTTEEPIVE
jgi:ABC-type multidrug transport system permease subunit